MPAARRLARWFMGPSFAGRSIAHFLVSVVFLGLVVYLLKGRDLNVSLWGGLAMALAYITVGVVVEAILRRRR